MYFVSADEIVNTFLFFNIHEKVSYPIVNAYLELLFILFFDLAQSQSTLKVQKDLNEIP